MTFTPEIEEKDISKPTSNRRFSRRRWIGVLLLCFIAFGAYLFFTNRLSKPSNPSEKKTPPGVPVVAEAAKKSDMGLYVTGLGTVTPLQTVTVRSRVDGQLMTVHFKEGEFVKDGDLLASIDPRPFEVQLTQAEGQMARDQALLQNAHIDLDRYRVLWEQDSIPRQQLDTQESLVRQYEGAVKADQGQVDSAKLQLVYCSIASPLSGRVGLRLVDSGNIVHASDTNGLLVITQLEPITVIFPIPEDSIPQVLAKLRAGQSLAVEAFDRAMRQKLAEGSLLTADNQIDTNTGTVRLKAVFPNKGHELFPNQFVNVRLLVEMKRGATVVPAAAIQRGLQGSFVYLVKPDKTATVRPVTVGEIQGGEASILKGLSPGDLVVVDGAERLREGARVELRAPNTGTGEASRPESGASR